MEQTTVTEKPKNKQQLNHEFLQNLGMELKVARIRAKLSRSEMVKLTGLSLDAIMHVENGDRECKILTYKRMADALGMSLKEVL